MLVQESKQKVTKVVSLIKKKKAKSNKFVQLCSPIYVSAGQIVWYLNETPGTGTGSIQKLTLLLIFLHKKLSCGSAAESPPQVGSYEIPLNILM